MKQDPCSSNCRVARKGQLFGRSEDSDRVVVAVDRGDERRLGQVHFRRDPLHLVGGKSLCIGEYRQWISHVRGVGENVDLNELHPYILSGAPTPSRPSASAMTVLVPRQRVSRALVSALSSVITRQSR